MVPEKLMKSARTKALVRNCDGRGAECDIADRYGVLQLAGDFVDRFVPKGCGIMQFVDLFL